MNARIVEDRQGEKEAGFVGWSFLITGKAGKWKSWLVNQFLLSPQ
jgi:hypothetical protein